MVVMRVWEAEEGASLSLRLAWSTEQVPGQPRLLRETLSWKKRIKEQSLSLNWRQVDPKFNASLVYTENSKLSKTRVDPVSMGKGVRRIRNSRSSLATKPAQNQSGLKPTSRQHNN